MSTVNSNKQFITNILESLDTSSYLRNDGKAMGLFDRFFRSKEQHFKEVCNRLLLCRKEFLELKDITQLRILKKINEINKKLKCDYTSKISPLERMVFQSKKMVRAVEAVFDDLAEAYKMQSKITMGKNLKEIELIVDYFDKNIQLEDIKKNRK